MPRNEIELLFLTLLRNILLMLAGISKISTPYTVGEKTIDVMLDVLNLDKRETVSIDRISNQEFTEVSKFTLLIVVCYCHRSFETPWLV